MAPTRSLVEVVDQLIANVQTDIDGANTLGLKDVFYGDVELVQAFPAVAIEGNTRMQTPAASGISQEIDFHVVATVYHSLLQNEEVTRRQQELFTEQVSTFLESDRQLGDLVAWCWVGQEEHGFRGFGNSAVRASRIHWYAKGKGRM